MELVVDVVVEEIIDDVIRFIKKQFLVLGVVLDIVQELIEQSEDEEEEEEYNMLDIEGEFGVEEMEEKKEVISEELVKVFFGELVKEEKEFVKVEELKEEVKEVDKKVEEKKDNEEVKRVDKDSEMEIQVVNVIIIDDDVSSEKSEKFSDSEKKDLVIIINGQVLFDRGIIINGQSVLFLGIIVVINGDVVGVKFLSFMDNSIDKSMFNSSDSVDIVFQIDLDIFETKVIKELKRKFKDFSNVIFVDDDQRFDIESVVIVDSLGDGEKKVVDVLVEKRVKFYIRGRSVSIKV